MRVDLQVDFTPGTRFTYLRCGAENLPWAKVRLDEILSNWSATPSVRSVATRSSQPRLKDRIAWSLQEIVQYSDFKRPSPRRACRYSLELIRRVAKSVESSGEDLPNAFDSKLPDACLEATNSLIQTAQAGARGHGTTKHLRTDAYTSAGKLIRMRASPFQLPSHATGAA